MGTEEIVATLRGVDLFSGLSPRVLARIADSGRVAEYAPGAEVVHAGDKVGGFRAFSAKGVEMHVVLTGEASVRVHADQVGALGPGSYFGELSLIDGQPRSADVIAGGNGLRTFALPKWAFDEMLRDHPEMAVPMLKALCAKLRRAESATG